jgi:hypothetical protein
MIFGGAGTILLACRLWESSDRHSGLGDCAAHCNQTGDKNYPMTLADLRHGKCYPLLGPLFKPQSAKGSQILMQFSC